MNNTLGKALKDAMAKIEAQTQAKLKKTLIDEAPIVR